MMKRGLTLIELLIVFSIISLLLAVAFPSLVRVRNQAQGAVCLQNAKTLSFAWLLFKDDNDDHLVNGNIGSDPSYWVASPSGATTEQEREGIRRGALFHYVGKVDSYRCPADQRKLGQGRPAFRSYSISGGANGETWKDSYTPAQKYSQLLRPASKYVFVEEADPRGYNKGSWVLDVRSRSWVDPLAIWHSGARSTLGYADGRAEIQLWKDKSTLELSRQQAFLYPVPPGEGGDLRFMLDGFPQNRGEPTAP